MLKYKIESVREFSVCGMGTEITKWQNKNTEICKKFWIEFNSVLYQYGLHQFGDWKKYAFIYKKDGKLYYFCSIPEQFKIPKVFSVKEIPRQTYLVCKHIGDMRTIKDTVNQIYKEFLPQHKFVPQQDRFFHFERYDKRFNKDAADSIIDIYLPVEKETAYEEMDLYDESKYL